VRTRAAAFDADVNLEFFGLGGDRRPGEVGLGYGVAARGATAGASVRVGDTPLWLGLQYGLASTTVTAGQPDFGVPGIPTGDRDLRLGALVPSITVDARDNFFTPTRGWYLDLSLPLFREALGSDRDFNRPMLTAMAFQPLGPTLFLSARGGARSSSDGTPLYLRPFVVLRGVQALRYQGERAAEAEVELRWQAHRRFSAVAFGGAGIARSDGERGERDKRVTAAGIGLRYLLARTYGLHMGLDLAWGPDKPIVYVVFGSAWARP
jgi:hypothetical protein